MKWFWAFLLIGGFALAVFTGGGAEVTDGFFEGTSSAVQLFIELIGAYVLWLGVLNIAKRAGLVEGIAKVFRKGLRFLFPTVEKDSAAFGFITLNMVANLLGLGNAATPFGISAMRELQGSRKSRVATDAMCMFLVLNASAIQLIPTTVISLRSAAGSVDPAAVTIPALIVDVVTVVCGVAAVKLLQRRY
ncbi:MAG: nucleoside recognition domain-containing protein [Christensenellales bacterium]|jgi:spore maturation protein A